MYVCMPGAGGGGEEEVNWVSFCWVCVAGPNLSHFWGNVIFAIPTHSLSVHESTLKSILTRSS